jgi:hypothetical protein
MAVKEIKITKTISCFFDRHGGGFAGGFVIYPAVSFFTAKGYLQIGLSFMNKSISITFMYFPERWEKEKKKT